jgi:hypothetical protein
VAIIITITGLVCLACADVTTAIIKKPKAVGRSKLTAFYFQGCELSSAAFFLNSALKKYDKSG